MPSPGTCPLEHPERESSYVIVITVGADGSVLDATVPGEPSEAVHACLLRAVGRWNLEPARNCLGEALPGKYEVEYPYVFGYACFHWWEAGASGASGRTSGCS
jgi:hypothetical protein